MRQSLITNCLHTSFQHNFERQTNKKKKQENECVLVVYDIASITFPFFSF